MKKRKISPNAYEKAYKLICKRLKADDLRCVESGIVPGTWMLASKFGIIRILAVDGFSRYSSKNLRSRDAIMNFVEDCAADVLTARVRHRMNACFILVRFTFRMAKLLLFVFTAIGFNTVRRRTSNF